MKTKLFILICFLLTEKVAYPQAVYTMPVTGTQTDTACGGMFYDSGGSTLNYTNANNTSLLTIYPVTSGQYVGVTFTFFSSEFSVDRLRIFSGSDTATFLGQLTGTGAACVTFVSVDSISGSLTFQWITNGVINAAGWRAMLYCVPSPSPIPPGINCANPVVIPSIPFTDAGQCTECMGNDYHGQSGICNATYVGEDRVYSYTAAGTETVCITMSNTTGNSTLAVYEGCPGMGGVCITPVPMVGNDSMQVTFPAAGTYYIIIDEPMGFSCYDLGISSCIVGMDEQENSRDGVLIFPNPLTHELRIENAELKIEKIEFYNAFGEKITIQQPKANSQKQIVVDVSYFVRGIYFVRITGEKNYSAIRKIVKL